MLRLTFAGAFQTPRVLSTEAYTPAIAAAGGKITENRLVCCLI
ncbi:hypothetical protein ACRQ5D_18935 [Mucilaginibacter sp. P25]